MGQITAVPGTTGLHSTLSPVIGSLVAQPTDMMRPIRSSYKSNNVYFTYFRTMYPTDTSAFCVQIETYYLEGNLIKIFILS